MAFSKGIASAVRLNLAPRLAIALSHAPLTSLLPKVGRVVHLRRVGTGEFSAHDHAYGKP
jgi:hypothetical protein